MSHRQDLLKRIEALEISRKLIDDEIKRIEALKISRELIDEKIALANLSLENLEAEQEAIWKENQFVKCNLTTKDLQIIEDSLVDTFSGIYHGRVKYPQDKKDQNQASNAQTVQENK